MTRKKYKYAKPKRNFHEKIEDAIYHFNQIRNKLREELQKRNIHIPTKHIQKIKKDITTSKLYIKIIKFFYKITKGKIEKIKKLAIYSAIIGVVGSGLQQQSFRAIETGEKVSCNPFKILYYAFFGGGFFKIWMFGIIFFSIVIYIMYKKLDNKNWDERGFLVSDRTTYGSSNMMTDEEKEEAILVTKVEDTGESILGKPLDMEDYVAVLNWEYFTKHHLSFNKHKMFVGASGSGKSFSGTLVEALQCMARNESFLFTDPKSEGSKILAELAKKRGYKTRFLNLINPLYSDAIDLMQFVNGNVLVAETFTKVVFENTKEENRQDFWYDVEMMLHTACLLYEDLKTDGTPKRYANVFNMVNDNKPEQLDRLFKALPEGHPAKKPYNSFANASDTVRTGAILGLIGRLQVFHDRQIQEITSYNEIDLTAPGKEKCAYFLIISDQETTLKFISALFLTFFFIKEVRYADSRFSQRVKVPVTLILDEFINIGKVPDFTTKLTTIRSRGISCSIVIQNVGQLEDTYPGNEWNTIFGNCDVLTVLGVNDVNKTGAYLEELSGTMTVNVESEQRGKNDMAILDNRPEHKETTGEGKRSVIMRDEFRRSKNMYVFIRGYNVLELKKFGYIEHPLAKEIEEKNPLDHNPRWWQRLYDGTDEKQADMAASKKAGRYHKKAETYGEGKRWLQEQLYLSRKEIEENNKDVEPEPDVQPTLTADMILNEYHAKPTAQDNSFVSEASKQHCYAKDNKTSSDNLASCVEEETYTPEYDAEEEPEDEVPDIFTPGTDNLAAIFGIPEDMLDAENETEEEFVEDEYTEEKATVSNKSSGQSRSLRRASKL